MLQCQPGSGAQHIPCAMTSHATSCHAAESETCLAGCSAAGTKKGQKMGTRRRSLPSLFGTGCGGLLAVTVGYWLHLREFGDADIQRFLVDLCRGAQCGRVELEARLRPERRSKGEGERIVRVKSYVTVRDCV